MEVESFLKSLREAFYPLVSEFHAGTLKSLRYSGGTKVSPRPSSEDFISPAVLRTGFPCRRLVANVSVEFRQLRPRDLR